jgi:hypothetical protein
MLTPRTVAPAPPTASLRSHRFQTSARCDRLSAIDHDGV